MPVPNEVLTMRLPRPLPGLSALAILLAMSTASPSRAELELIVNLPPETPPGNIAVGPKGRIFLSVHEFYGQPLKLVELLPDGKTRPYPTEAWAHAPEGDGPGLNGVLGLNVDKHGVLWMLDTSSPERAGRLIGWDTRAERLKQIVYLAPPVIQEDSFLNDLAIDPDHDAVYIADTGAKAIVVVDLKTGRARSVLTGSQATSPEPIDMKIDGRVVHLGGQPARLGINPITIDPAGEHAYFGAMSGTAIYRVKTADLRNASLSPSELESRVERYGPKPISDGITIDGGGNVYVTSITDDSIGVVGPDHQYKTLYQHDDLSWPDGFAYGPDHMIYVTINELHRSPVLNGGENGSRGEFKVMRFRAITPGAMGR